MSRSSRSGLAAALLLFVVFLAVYAWTAAPTVLFGDPGELQAVALLGGIAHPTGYPLFVLSGYGFGKILSGDPAHRITLMAAFYGAASVSLLTLFLSGLGLPVWAALMGGAAFGCTYWLWSSSIRAEVYTISVLFYLIALAAFVRWLPRRTLGWALLTAFCLGLVVSSHLAFTPGVAAMGLFLAFRSRRPARSLPVYWVLLVACLCVGLAPFLTILAVDHAGTPMNYITWTMEPPSRSSTNTEVGAFSRLVWLVGGGGGRDATNYFLHPSTFIRNGVEAVAVLGLFELGPIGLLVAVVGASSLRRKHSVVAAVLIVALFLSFLLTASQTGGGMIPVFMMAGLVSLAIMFAFGTAVLAPRAFRMRSRTLGLLMVGAGFALAVVSPHLLRTYAQDHPLPPLGLRRVQEHAQRRQTLIPSLRNYYDPRVYGERVLELIPRNALVIGMWREINVLLYLHHVEGQRPDLVMDPAYPWHVAQYREWEEQHDVKERPFVFTSRMPGFAPYFGQVDSLFVSDGQSLYIRTTPLSTGLPHSTSGLDPRGNESRSAGPRS